jgi:hypothetical protein
VYGRDVRTVPLPRLRASMGVLLQRPFLASASLRENLDPRGAVRVAVAAAAGRNSSPNLEVEKKNVIEEGNMDEANGAAAFGETNAHAGGGVEEHPGGVMGDGVDGDGGDSDCGGGRAVSDTELGDVLRLVGLWDALASAAIHRRQRRHRRGHGSAGTESEPSTAVAAAAPPPPPPSAAEVLCLPLGSLPGAVGLSAGQQQLLCLARLLLRPRRLVLLDECSAHVDPATAAVIRRLVSEQILRRQDPLAVAPAAVLEVAHQLSAISGCDEVVVMEAGRAVEVGPPGALGAREGGRFRALLLASAGAAAGVPPTDGGAGGGGPIGGGA